MRQVAEFLVRLALAEDIGPGDITTKGAIPASLKARAVIRAKEAGIIAGLPVAKAVFASLDKKIRFVPKIKDGAPVKPGTIVAELSGPARGILTGERTALNFLQHLSGIATLTNRYVKKLRSAKSRAIILDTRKTIPGLRQLEKYAVRLGGAANHRLGLHDAFLIKDNHIKLAGGITPAIQAIKKEYRLKKGPEVEVKNLAEAREAIAAGASRLLLDNMDIKILRQAVKLCRRAKVASEASGGINLGNLRAVATSGADYISIGALTHSAPALDINLKII
ncbi:nicotinate-nucleotide diphosphorylase (carboxylating) [candidate division WOR-1 bacterium RIFOXYB2_FULL_48_7]|uniref:Probable nicotinate-nucleotide pyrophosphorylase [carboxylating] n=1 Tax=candidate division WOR-1 bacterium RIFOXYB2_FULL_48_7 TaxID=1802583 RepID=A0A1F4TUX5_UNCSA|nr:MAG: nicotinate-nucleotide diphosphorylase (carboxylating) [candidate division WOR-1 bacterium RIFOXYB2_FULL_48_7]